MPHRVKYARARPALTAALVGHVSPLRARQARLAAPRAHQRVVRACAEKRTKKDDTFINHETAVLFDLKRFVLKQLPSPV